MAVRPISCEAILGFKLAVGCNAGSSRAVQLTDDFYFVKIDNVVLHILRDVASTFKNLIGLLRILVGSFAASYVCTFKLAYLVPNVGMFRQSPGNCVTAIR